MIKFFRQIFLSCSDFPFYKTVVKQKVSQSVQYFILLLLAVTLISSVFYCFYFKLALNVFDEWSQKHMPEMMVRDGVVTSSVSQPYTAIEEDFVFVLDTTGTIDRIDPLYPNGILVKQSSVLVKRSGLEDQELDLTWIKSLELSAKVVSLWKTKAFPVLIPFVFLITLIGLLLSKFFQAFLFSYAASILYPKERTGLGFSQFFNLALYSATPPILIGVLAQVLKIQIPLFWWIYFGMYAAFFIGAFSQCRVIKEPDKNQDMDLDL